MGKIGKRDLRRWRGLKSLVHDAIDATSELVELGHESTARNVTGVTDRLPPLRTPARVVDGVRRLGTRGVLGTIKLVNRTVEAVSDVALDAVERRLDDEPGVVDALPMRSDTTSSGAWIADAALGLVNAAVGDHLGARAKPEGAEMPKFLCMQRSLPTQSQEKPSPAQMQEMYAKFDAWRTQFADNLVDLGGKLGEGELVSAEPPTDGPYVEVKELIGGYMIVQAESLSAAIEVARACPGLVRPGSGVEVIEIHTPGA